jgi:molecular chaperone HscC
MTTIGIDLGTTNSLVTCFKEGEPVVIPNVFGEYLTPSVVSVDENGEVFVGNIAKERLLTHPQFTVSVFKRSIGSKKQYQLGQKTFTPEELSAVIIGKLKEDAEEFLGEKIEEAVISVPAYFNDTQRRATKTAGELAGLKVERIVNEPTAAAVAYGLHEKKDYTKYLVFDLGGGTFDISILEKYNNIMEVRAVAGDNYLGGEDFTDILVSWFVKYHDIEEQELSLIEQGILRKSAELAKISLMDARSTTMSCILGGENYSMPVTIEEYEKKCELLFTRLRNPIKRALSDASILLKDIDSILLVGGATKLPLIKSFVTKLFGRFPPSHIDPDQVVAVGTAVHAALKERNEAIKEIVLTDVCPYTLGTNVVVYKPSGFFEAGHFYPIIERNSVIPISRSERLYTAHENQKTITIEILQGESRRTEGNVLLGEINIAVPQNRAGQEAVDVRYTYDINGILEVEVTIVSTGITKTLVIEKNPGILTEQEITEKLEALKELKIHPRDKDENRFLLARAERLYEENIGEDRLFLSQEILMFESLLDKQDEREIRDYAVRLGEIIKEIENREL